MRLWSRLQYGIFPALVISMLLGCSQQASNSASLPATASPPSSTPAPTLPPVVAPVPVTVSAGFLKDINTGLSQDVSVNWLRMGGNLYFVNNPATNAGHRIWKGSSTGAASLVADLGLENYVTAMIVDSRPGASPTRFYFIVNGIQLWTSDGTLTTKIAEYLDGGGIIASSALGNDLYYQVNGSGGNGQVFKSVNGAASGEIFVGGTLSFAVNVTFVPAATHMYIYYTAANSVVYSHIGAPPSAASIVTNLTAGNTVTQAKVVGDDFYYQESASFRVFKSLAGGPGGEILDNTALSVAGAVTTFAGSAHLYFYLNAANSKMFSHAGVAGSATLIDTTPAANSVSAARVVADDFYYQYSAAFNVRKSILGAASVEVKDSGGLSFASAVTTLAGATKMYIFYVGGAVSVYSHSGAALNATLVKTLTAANTVSVPAVVTDDIYFQENATFKVFKSVAGAAGAEVTDNAGVSIAAAVAFVPGSSLLMYFHGNVVGGNATVYSHTGPPGIATVVLNGAVGTFNSAKMITANDNLFFQGASTSPLGLFESIGGASAAFVSNYSPSADDDALCVVPAQPVAISSNLFFVANNGTNGCELWTTSGSPASTYMIADLNLGQVGANPRSLTVVGTRIYFVAQDNSIPASPNNTYLFYSDPPYSSSSKVTLTGGDPNPSPVYLTAIGTKIYFGASVGAVVTLYEHDGTGTAPAAIKRTSTPANLTMNAGTAPFIVPLGTSAVIRGAPLGGAVYDVYMSDSTQPVTENPALIKHINLSAVASSNPALFTGSVSGTTLFFTADDGTGIELWKTDGTAVNTVKIRNINGNPTASANANISQLTMVGTNLFFTAQDNMPADGGAELYVTQFPWSLAQKLTFRTSLPRVTNLTPLGSNLIFTMSEDGSVANSGIYKSDGTVAGTLRLRAPGGVAAPTFNLLNNGILNNLLYFVYDPNPAVGNQLFHTDGNVNGTVLHSGLNPTPSAAPDEVAPADAKNFAVIGTALVFPGNNGTNGTQLWSTEYTTKATLQISNFTPQDNNGAAPALLGIANGAAYYVLRDATHGRSVYKVTQP